MSSSIIQLLVLAGIAVFLILRLRSVLGTREGYEKPPVPLERSGGGRERPEFEVIEGGPDEDITDHVPEGSEAAQALAAMKAADRSFNVTEFLQGARAAYEMILDAFERGALDEIRGLLKPDVLEAFEAVVADREAQGLTVDAKIVGIREVALVDATYDTDTREGEITVRFVSEINSVVRNAEGEIVEGDPNQIVRQKDVWSFSRVMGTRDPNWFLSATGE